jgi:NADH-quinone oxidoreductase E subunit
MFSGEAAGEIARIRARYPNARSALLPVLHVAEGQYGWLSDEALHSVARELDLPVALVRGVASFHVLFRNEPAGRWRIQLCTNVACMLHDTGSLLKSLKERYGIEPDVTTADGRFTLEIMECIGACDRAPAMLVNGEVHDGLTPERTFQILDSCA